MSGFTRPSAAQSPAVSQHSSEMCQSEPTVLSGAASASSIRSAAASLSKSRKTVRVRATKTVTVAPSSMTAPVTSASMTGSAASSSSKSRWTVRVTRTVTVAPQRTMNMPVSSASPCTDKHSGHVHGMVMSSRSPPELTAHVKIPAPDVTSVTFQLYTPPSDSTQANASKPDGVNHAAIVGGIFGVIILVVIALFAYVKGHRKSRGARPDIESGRSRRRHNRSTDDVINDARRMRRKRNHKPVQPHTWNAADTVELMHQNDVLVAQQHVRGAAAPSSRGMDRTQLAQVHAWETSFANDTFSSRNKYPARIPSTRDARCPPPIVTRPSRLPSHRAKVGHHSRSPVSPLDGPYAASRGSRRGRSYADVSPLSSPVRGRGHGWPR